MATSESLKDFSKLIQEVVRMELSNFCEGALQYKIAEFASRIETEVQSVKNLYVGLAGAQSHSDARKIDVAWESQTDKHDEHPLRQTTITSEVLTSSSSTSGSARHAWSCRHVKTYSRTREAEASSNNDGPMPSPCASRLLANSLRSSQQVMNTIKSPSRMKSISPSEDNSSTHSVVVADTDVVPKPGREGSCQAHSPTNTTPSLAKTFFENGVAAVILLNAVYIGLSTHYMARNELSDPPLFVEVAECVFLALFVSELGLRFYMQRFHMFKRQTPDGRPNPNLKWNIFDTAVIGLQVIEKTFYYSGLHHIQAMSQMSVLRLLRLFKIIRLFRVMKMLRYVRDLRMIVYSIMRSLMLFFWSCVALFIMTYLWSIYLTDLVRDHNSKRSSDGLELDQRLVKYYGGVPTTMLTLLWTVTGGEDWSIVYEPLASIHQALLAWFPLLAYIFFASLAMMNVITGVFLETAMDRAKEEKEIFLIGNARIVFDRADTDKSGMISLAEFEKALNAEDMKDFFEAIDIDSTEAKSLFDLLDLSGDGKISSEEFLNGCLRVSGPAKALDLLVLSREVGQLIEKHINTTAWIARQVARSCEAIKANHEILASIQKTIARLGSGAQDLNVASPSEKLNDHSAKAVGNGTRIMTLTHDSLGAAHKERPSPIVTVLSTDTNKDAPKEQPCAKPAWQ